MRGTSDFILQTQGDIILFSSSAVSMKELCNLIRFRFEGVMVGEEGLNN
jgi:hypothetical protein